MFRPVYGCNQCDFKTVFKHSLKTHSIKHKVYTCDVCDLEIESAYALVKHRKTHQVNPKNRIYLCDVCGFQSKNDRSLKMHKKTHNPEFKCPDCPFQTHSKVRNFSVMFIYFTITQKKSFQTFVKYREFFNDCENFEYSGQKIK